MVIAGAWNIVFFPYGRRSLRRRAAYRQRSRSVVLRGRAVELLGRWNRVGSLLAGTLVVLLLVNFAHARALRFDVGVIGILTVLFCHWRLHRNPPGVNACGEPLAIRTGVPRHILDRLLVG
jgi:hypothetical protein